MRIRLLILVVILFLVIVPSASAQTTTVTGQVTDSGGQSWNNGTFLFTLQGGTGAIWTGGTLNRSIPAAGPGNLSSTGAIPSTGVPDTGTITPSGSTWRLTVCSATVPQQCFAQNLTITGASQVLTVTPPAISIQVSNSPVLPPPVIVAYADSEISGAWQGFSYFNAVTLTNRTCSAGTAGVTGPCTAYVAGGSGGGSGIPYGTGGGTAQAQTVTTTPNITALTTGTYVTWLPVAANTASAPTLAAGTTAAKPITKFGTVALLPGDLLTTVWAVAQYDGTEWVLQNPATAAEGGLPTSGGTANAQTLTISPAITAYSAGLVFNFTPGVANTGAATMAISGLAVRNITKC